MYRIVSVIGVSIIGLLIAAAALGQDGPSYDCSRAESSAEKLICDDAGLATLDRRLAARYAAALGVIRELDAGGKEAEDNLRAYQRGWIKGRDACWKAVDLRTCVEDAYLHREGELVAQWFLEEPSGVAFWNCAGNPAIEVVTYFFDTERPGVRFERGDTVDTGSLVPGASGSGYAGNFGRSIWIRGEAATYREPDPDGTSYECVLARRSLHPSSNSQIPETAGTRARRQ